MGKEAIITFRIVQYCRHLLIKVLFNLGVHSFLRIDQTGLKSSVGHTAPGAWLPGMPKTVKSLAYIGKNLCHHITTHRYFQYDGPLWLRSDGDCGNQSRQLRTKRKICRGDGAVQRNEARTSTKDNTALLLHT